MRRIAIAIILFSLLLSGCVSAIQTPPPDRKTLFPHIEGNPAGTIEPTATQISGEGGLPGGALAAQADLAQLLKLTRSDVIIRVVQAVSFSDSCLGLGQPNESCLAQTTEGFVVVLQADGVDYAYHTNADGTILRLVQSIPTGALQAVQVAQVILAGQLGLGSAEQVQVVDALAVDWPDACLGATTSGADCAQVITPGFRILLGAQGGLYEFHANLDGTQLIQVETP